MGTRETLLAAASELLDEGGPGAVTLREVGRRSGVSHNAPYRHFADKEALLEAVAAAELVRLVDVLAPAAGDLREIMRGYVAWALGHPARFKLVFGRWTRESPEITAAASTSHGLLELSVEHAQSAGEIPAGDPQRLTALLLALAHGAVDMALSGHLAADGKGRATPADLVDDLFAYLQAAVTT